MHNQVNAVWTDERPPSGCVAPPRIFPYVTKLGRRLRCLDIELDGRNGKRSGGRIIQLSNQCGHCPLTSLRYRRPAFCHLTFKRVEPYRVGHAFATDELVSLLHRLFVTTTMSGMRRFQREHQSVQKPPTCACPVVEKPVHRRRQPYHR